MHCRRCHPTQPSPIALSCGLVSKGVFALALPTSTIYRDSAGRVMEDFDLPYAQSAMESALRGSQAYLASSGMVATPVDSALYVILRNPVGSGKLLFIDERWFDNNRASGSVPLEYTAFVTPTATLASTAPVANLYFGGSNASAGVMTYQTGAGIVMGGTQASAAPIPTGGVRANLDLNVIIPPGQGLGFRIDGGGANINQAARIGMTFVWHEEPIA